MKTTNKYNMSFAEAQEYVSKRGLDIPWNDCDVFIDEREITRTVGNVLKWADKTMIDKACECFCKTCMGQCKDSTHCDTLQRFMNELKSVEE